MKDFFVLIVISGVVFAAAYFLGEPEVREARVDTIAVKRTRIEYVDGSCEIVVNDWHKIRREPCVE